MHCNRLMPRRDSGLRCRGGKKSSRSDALKHQMLVGMVATVNIVWPSLFALGGTIHVYSTSDHAGQHLRFDRILMPNYDLPNWY